MKKILFLFTFLASVLASFSTNAQSCPGATRDVSNCKASTPNDAIGAAMKDFFQSGGGASATWRFESGAKFVENTDGTARLTGVLAYYDKPTTHRFNVDILFIGQTYTPPMGSPVLMNTNPNTTGWYYYDWGTATMTGLNDLAGAKVNLKKRGKAFQVGVGASDQIVDTDKFGATGWFSWEIVSQPTNTSIVINSFPANPSIDQADLCIGLSGTPTNCGNNCETDKTPPTFSGCPANMNITTLFTTDNCAVATWTAPTATDNCGTPTVTLSTAPTAGLASGACFPIGVTTVTYTATDAKGNKATCSFTITVTKKTDPCADDATPPTFANCPANITVKTAFSGDNCAVATWTAPTATDNCGAPVVILTTAPTAGLASGGCFPIGVTTVTYTATDAKGNKATCSFTITVTTDNPCGTDNIPPKFSNCPANISTSTGSNCANVNWTAPTATDNCSTPTITFTTAPTIGLNNGSCFPVGVTTVTYTATDTKGNKATCTFNITVTTTCSQVTDPGAITGDEDFCPGSYLSPILESRPASGGSGDIEYLWMYSTSTNVFNPATWRVIEGETGKDLRNVPAVTSTSYFIRCVRRKGCELFTETNFVTKKVKSSAAIAKGVFTSCVGKEVVFEAGDLGVGTATYVWYFEGADISYLVSRTAKIKFLSSGTKKVTLEVYNLGCVSRVTRNVDVSACAGGAGVVQSFNLSIPNTKNISLNWITANEILPSKYVVERSTDGKIFAPLAEVSSKNLDKNLYDYNDNSPKMGRSFYRIKHIESDGTVSYTVAKKAILFINGSEGVMTYPNPTNNQVFVEVLDSENTEGVIEVYNTVGKLMQSKKFTKDQARYELDLSDLPIGNYFLKVSQNNGETKTTKISKF